MTTTLTRGITAGPPARTRSAWPLWGVAAGVAGIVGSLVTNSGNTPKDTGAEVIATLHRSTYQVGVVAGFAAVLLMLVTAAGWRRWAEGRAADSLAARVISLALTASAGAMMIGYGFKGSMAVYLPGGTNAHTFSKEGLLSIYMLLDFGPFIAWWGVGVAAAATAWVALRERTLPRWIGVLSTVFVVLPALFLVGIGLPGFFGVVDPLWLIVVSVGMALRESRTTVGR